MFFFASRRRHTRYWRDWSSDVCSSDLEETARGLGLSSWAVFLRVQLPQLRAALLGGSLLVALHLLAEFGALQMLRYPTFTTAIYDQYRATFNGPGATMLAGVLVLLCLGLLLAELRLRGRRG